MTEFGRTVPWLVAENGEPIAGLGRMLAATQLALTEAPSWVEAAQAFDYSICDALEIDSGTEPTLSLTHPTVLDRGSNRRCRQPRCANSLAGLGSQAGTKGSRMIWVVGIGLGLFLLYAYPRQMLAMIVIVLVGGGALFASLKYTDDQQTRDRESVRFAATFEPGGCAPEFPILVKISNTNTKTLLAVSFGLAGFQAGQSAPLYQGRALASDRIIPPGQSHEGCWSVPGLNEASSPEVLSWKATVSYATFGALSLAR